MKNKFLHSTPRRYRLVHRQTPESPTRSQHHNMHGNGQSYHAQPQPHIEVISGIYNT